MTMKHQISKQKQTKNMIRFLKFFLAVMLYKSPNQMKKTDNLDKCVWTTCHRYCKWVFSSFQCSEATTQISLPTQKVKLLQAQKSSKKSRFSRNFFSNKMIITLQN